MTNRIPPRDETHYEDASPTVSKSARIAWDGGRAILYFIFTATFSLLLGLILYDFLGFYGAIVVSEVLAFGLIPIALSRFFDTGLERWIGAAKVDMTFWFWAVIGIVAFSVAQSNLPVLIDRYYPIPDEQLEMFGTYLTAGSPLKFFLIVLVAAVIPAVCEEICFRGVILSGLRRSFGARHAIIWSGFLFALLHMTPWTFFGLWTLGCFLGYLTIRLNSIRPAIFLHLLNNLFALTLFYVKGKSAWEERPEYTPWYWTLAAGVVLVYAVWKIHQLTAPIADATSQTSDGYPVQPHSFDHTSDTPRE